MIAVVVGAQFAASLGFYAVMAHAVAHLRDDAGLLAATIGLVMGVRTAVQYALFLPVGALTDLIGAPRAGVAAGVLRAAGFALLGTADGLAGLLTASVLLGAGGALFHPAAQSLLAGTAPAHRDRGFAAYTITGQVAAVAGPPAGLVLIAAGGGAWGGFGLLSAASAGAWGVAALLFVLLHRSRAPRPDAARPDAARPDAARPDAARGGAGHRGSAQRVSLRGVFGGVRDVLRDRRFIRFTLAAAPYMLLAEQTMTVVPLKDFGTGATTLFLCGSAAVAASVQPWCAAGGRARRPGVLRAGLLCAGAGYLLLLTGGGFTAGLPAAAVLNGLAQGLLLPSIFQSVVGYAPRERIGAYLGVFSCCAGMAAFAGGLAVGHLFDAGPAGAAAALTGLAVVAALSAAATGARAARISIGDEYPD